MYCFVLDGGTCGRRRSSSVFCVASCASIILKRIFRRGSPASCNTHIINERQIRTIRTSSITSPNHSRPANCRWRHGKHVANPSNSWANGPFINSLPRKCCSDLRCTSLCNVLLPQPCHRFRGIQSFGHRHFQ